MMLIVVSNRALSHCSNTELVNLANTTPAGRPVTRVVRYLLPRIFIDEHALQPLLRLGRCPWHIITHQR
jgi:hypothetical protein